MFNKAFGFNFFTFSKFFNFLRIRNCSRRKARLQYKKCLLFIIQ